MSGGILGPQTLCVDSSRVSADLAGRLMAADDPRDLNLIFAECLAAELGMDMTPELVAAADKLVVRLWVAGVKIGRLVEGDMHQDSKQ